MAISSRLHISYIHAYRPLLCAAASEVTVHVGHARARNVLIKTRVVRPSERLSAAEREQNVSGRGDERDFSHF